MVSPVFALLAGLALVLTAVVCLWPGWGIAARWRRGVTASDRVRVEDALKHLWDSEYRQRSAGLESLAGTLGLNGREAAALVERLDHLNLVQHGPRGLELTVEGRRAALRVVRIHRLWERYLADQTGLTAQEWHAQAELHEHLTSDAEAEALAASLGNPRFDPHGDPIPLVTGEVPPHSGKALTELRAGDAGTIVHVEDEPDVVFAQIAAAGLVPGMQVRVLEHLPHRIRLAADSEDIVLAPLVAANITVEAIQDVVDLGPTTPMSAMAPGEVARVVALSPTCRGAQRRRLLDLGIVPGTQVVHELAAPGGDPMAFRIRGALIALRRDHAALIHVDRATEVQG